ncbi:MAG: pseudouridine synthase, partial [Betaproteobacteria bacterium]
MSCRRGGRARAAPDASVILFNKPHGVLCQFSADDTARRTLKDFIAIREVYPAGRLDTDSEGLVILTADGALQATLTHPRHKRLKTYWVQVEGAVNKAALLQLRSGVALIDGPTRPAGARAI